MSLSIAPADNDQPASTGFSLTPELIQSILTHAKPLGHNESPDSLNLGFGFIYYGLVRALRPPHIVVIGSGYGFSVTCLALGLKDNGWGRLTFVDPSYSVLTDGPFKTVGGTAQWSDAARVKAHFGRFGVADLVTHHRLRSQDFFDGYAGLGLPEIDMAFIDGSHAYGDVRQDFLSTLRHSHKNTYMLMHDTNIYVRELLRHAGVKRWLRKVATHKDLFEVIDLPFSSGLAMVRVRENAAWKALRPPLV